MEAGYYFGNTLGMHVNVDQKETRTAQKAILNTAVF